MRRVVSLLASLTTNIFWFLVVEMRWQARKRSAGEPKTQTLSKNQRSEILMDMYLDQKKKKKMKKLCHMACFLLQIFGIPRSVRKTEHVQNVRIYFMCALLWKEEVLSMVGVTQRTSARVVTHNQGRGFMVTIVKSLAGRLIFLLKNCTAVKNKFGNVPLINMKKITEVKGLNTRLWFHLTVLEHQ